MSTRLLIGVRDAAWTLSLSRSQLYELLSAGEIESVKVGARRLVPRDALESFVERLRSGEGGVRTSPLMDEATTANSQRGGDLLDDTVPVVNR